MFNLEHTFFVVALFLVGLLIGYSVPATWVGVIFFIGREHAQAEYRWIERFGSGLRANLPWWATFDKRVWDFHSWFWNLTLPILAAIFLSFFYFYIICRVS
ncbi:MAG: hypothetical protein RIR39_1545 [Pseudomonadota bacterium]|jgi:ABC-type dipeptide/oligopeptide/nickel transport system permease component